MAGDALSAVLAAVESTVGPVTGEPEPLDGGITNRNYRLEVDGRAVVLRLLSTGLEVLGIDRDCERDCARWAGDQGFGPGVLADGDGWILSEWVPGRPLTAGRVPDEVISALARALRRVHDGPRQPNVFDPLVLAAAQKKLARGAGVALPEDLEEIEAGAARIRSWLDHDPDHARGPCHNDLLGGNVLWDGEEMWLVDWDYAGENDPFFDLANFSVNNELTPVQDERLLQAYLGAPPAPQHVQALLLLKVISDLREAMWGVVQQTLSSIEFDYAGYAERHFTRLRATLEEVDVPAS